MIRAEDITYEAINGNNSIYRVKIANQLIGYVFYEKDEGVWIYMPRDSRECTTGITRTIAVGRSILKK